jgi:protein xylosyltransferase
MGIKLFMISFMVTSILFSLLYIPTKLTTPNAKYNPVINLNMLKDLKPYPVTFAYLISASRGDAKRLTRVLKALYHPGNYYLIHVDADAPEKEHREIAEFVSSDPVFGLVGNVWIVGKPNLVTYRGPTMLATTLHAMAILLRTCKWDWFINLSASDYPLVTQDGMVSGPFFFILFALSSVICPPLILALCFTNPTFIKFLLFLLHFCFQTLCSIM